MNKSSSFIFFFLYVIILFFCNRGSFLWVSFALLYVFLTVKFNKRIYLYLFLFIGVVVILANFNKIDFSASRSNSIYGNSSTVQPKSLTLIPMIKDKIKAVEKSSEEFLLNVALLAKQSINNHPLIGMGVFSSRLYIQECLNIPTFTSAYPHNFFLEVFMQFGLVIPLLSFL